MPARLPGLTASNAAALGAAMLLTVPCLAGSTAARTTGAVAWASVLCVQPTSVGWLCWGIIRIFRLCGGAGPVLSKKSPKG